MAEWERVRISVDGVASEAQAPLIISASRATDIPAFYSDWLLHRLEQGYVKWVNPFSGKPSYVSFAQARLFVFWTKNPQPLMAHLDALGRMGLNYYVQFTLNDYEAERLEPGVPPLDRRVETFLELSERIGKEKVIWRFDPLVLTDTLGVDDLLKKIEAVGSRVRKHTRQLVISFADIGGYGKVSRNLKAAGVPCREFGEAEMRALAQGLSELNREWGLEIGSCAEVIDLSGFGIGHACCVDGRMIARVFGHDPVLTGFVGGSRGRAKDKGQRAACGCIASKDIGAYNTCPHLCAYCYANACPSSVSLNCRKHASDPFGAGL
jgi:hypothetical protein